MNKVIVVDKAKDMTSRDVVNKLNRIFNTKKVGHTGTLDPLATGVLVVCFGKYTKLVDKITALNKTYIATVKLGVKTDTLDVTGIIIEERNFEVNESRIKEVLETFKGKSIQEVPLYSSVKINGKKLYEYARNGEKIDLPKREIEVFDIKLLEILNDGFVFETSVSKGTYIRSLINDIANQLGTVGVMKELRRTSQGIFTIDNSNTLEEIENGNYKSHSLEDIFNYKVIDMNDEIYFKVKNGAKINILLENGNYIMKYLGSEIAIYSFYDNLGKIEVMV